MEKFGPEVKNLIRRLLESIPLYFDRNLTLNSDGRRLLSQLLRYLLYEHQEYRYLAREIRKNPTIENVIKLARIILSSDEINKILDIQLKGLYEYSIDSADHN
ncbi:MAG: hypothetical protein QXJ56_03130 [Ignisphaera sp.]|uniref:Uncharacterized protein n=2 Tax=Ignisphaera aggregans TaxID=334771 RepID=A0A7J3JTG5_9CREN